MCVSDKTSSKMCTVWLVAIHFIFVSHVALAYVDVIDLGTLGGEKCEAFDINNQGVVVGTITSAGASSAFRWQNGLMQQLGTIPGLTGSSSAHAINDVMQIVGSFYPANGLGGVRAFLWDSSIGMQDIVGENTQGRGINQLGDVVGWDDNGDSFIWNTGAITPVPYDRANDISNSRQVVGELPGFGSFVWEGDNQTVMTGGGPDHGINNRNEFVTGSSFYRKVNEDWEYTKIEPPTGLDQMLAFDINEHAEVVGRIGLSSDSSSRAFVWTESQGATDLNDLIDPASGWTLTDARAINDRGEVVGWGTNPDGMVHAYLLRLRDILMGDLNYDGFVGIADLNTVLSNWNADAGFGNYQPGDLTGDGYVGIDDLNRVLGNWNAGTPPVATAIPEPATLMMLSVAGSSLIYMGRRHAHICA